ncbi:hypothetical protein PUN28_003783 [Cardiocondyla obscurior]|uniref:Uncharacterized protein n=1 Tax=Cardiocondyla obscurior TaxID=286306 RepID=A0AAW2GP49_9HYME
MISRILFGSKTCTDLSNAVATVARSGSVVAINFASLSIKFAREETRVRGEYTLTETSVWHWRAFRRQTYRALFLSHDTHLILPLNHRSLLSPASSQPSTMSEEAPPASLGDSRHWHEYTRATTCQRIPRAKCRGAHRETPAVETTSRLPPNHLLEPRVDFPSRVESTRF